MPPPSALSRPTRQRGAAPARHRRLLLVCAAVGSLLAALTIWSATSRQVAAKPGPAAQRSGRPDFLPDGPPGAWTLAFDSEFDGTSVDTSLWSSRSSAESDDGQGNLPNAQLEWNQPQNCSVANGYLTITSRRQHITSPSGIDYAWTSCLLTTTPSYAFRYGYMETRAKFPGVAGFWPGFWTWQEGDDYIETDAFEFHSNEPGEIFLTQHSGSQGGCEGLHLGFDPSAAFHTYGVDIEPSGTTWYIDGTKVCSASGTSTGLTNIIINDFVYANDPPSPATYSAAEEIEYVRSWQHSQ